MFTLPGLNLEAAKCTAARMPGSGRRIIGCLTERGGCRRPDFESGCCKFCSNHFLASVKTHFQLARIAPSAVCLQNVFRDQLRRSSAESVDKLEAVYSGRHIGTLALYWEYPVTADL